MKFFLTLLICSCVIGCGSSTTTTTTSTPSPALEKTYGPIEIAEDTVLAVATAGGLSYSALPKTKTPVRTESLTNVGDEIVMKYGESVFIVLDSLNPAAVTIESRIDETTKTVTLRVVDKTKDVVLLTHKCQTVGRVGGGATSFPRVELADGLSPEQVVVTPMCDEKNRLAGYSIRYGSEERGCQIQAQAGLRSFHRCNEKITPEPKKVARTKTPNVRNDTWRLLFYGDERK
ncbi:MAG: hypothetical protein NTX15_00180 [Candidatus Kapabacteria bacterium]|nr:hypothetical protein [Candidatus Kapabacteria bacterium]